MKVFIHDDFDLAKICASGQCFRPGPAGAGGTACAGTAGAGGTACAGTTGAGGLACAGSVSAGSTTCAGTVGAGGTACAGPAGAGGLACAGQPAVESADAPAPAGAPLLYRFITGNHVLFIRHLEGEMYDVSCREEEWSSVWRPYFDLDRCYADVRASIPADDPFLTEAASFSRGIRILRQDPWEMIISFIISQRKTIPAIRKSIEMLCDRFGVPIGCDVVPGCGAPIGRDAMPGCGAPIGRDAVHSCGAPIGCDAVPASSSVIYSFPSPEALARASAEELSACSLGYRVPYVMDAAKKIASGQIDPEALYDCSYDERMEILKSIYGIGEKVAGCICLFGYGCTSAAPVDIWIRKVIDTVYAGDEPFSAFGDRAGIVQQYVFYYAVSRRRL